MNMETKLTLPFYQPTGRECDLFETAHDNGLPLLLKGPTGCGKTRFVEHMAARLAKPLHTVACHDDLSAADLIGRYLLKGGETVWVDGPLTRAVRVGSVQQHAPPHLQVLRRRAAAAVDAHHRHRGRRRLPRRGRRHRLGLHHLPKLRPRRPQDSLALVRAAAAALGVRGRRR